MCGRPSHENAQVKRITCQKKKGQDPHLLRWLEGHTQSPYQKRRQQNVEPTPLQSRPADQRMTQRHPEDGPEKRSQEPNCSNSFIRDQIVRSRPDRGDLILKEYRPDIQSRLRYDRVGENPLDPQGDPIAKQLRIDERNKPSF